MTCLSCKSNPAVTNYQKTLVEGAMELRDYIKKEIVHEGTELYNIDSGTSYAKDAISKDTNALETENRTTYEDRGMYYKGSVGYMNIVTYVGIHKCTSCNSFWWVEFKKKKDLRIVDYTGPYDEEPCNEFFDLEATVTAKIVDASVSNALQEVTLSNYYVIGSKTDLFARFYDIHFNYFEAIKKNEAEKMVEFYNSEAYQSIQESFYVRNEWPDYIKRFGKKKKK